MYQRLHIENFKAIRCMDVALDRLTIFIGPNGCGKTSVLQAMDVYGRIAAANPGEVILGGYGLEVLRSRGAKGPVAIEAGGDGWAVRWTSGGMPYSPATLQWNDGEGMGPPIESNRPMEERLPPALQGRISRAKLLQFEHRQLAAPSPAAAREPTLLSDGSNLATVLAFLKAHDEPIAKRIIEALRSVVQSVRDVRVRPAEVPRLPRRRELWAPSDPDEPKVLAGHEIVFDTESGTDIPAHAASDGTLRVLALLVEAFGPAPAPLILLDDLDRGVHPRAMAELVRALREVAHRHDGPMVAATTHSPYLLEQFDPKREIRLMWLDGGEARCISMADHPRYADWQELMSPAELWSAMDRTLPPRHNVA